MYLQISSIVTDMEYFHSGKIILYLDLLQLIKRT